MSLKAALVTTFIIQFLIRVGIGLVLIDAQYQLETVLYKYLFMFSGLIIITIGVMRLLKLFSVLRHTK
jgi:hypothetical protein